MRLKLFFFSIFVIFCAAFHKQAIGTAARYILLYSNECQLGYRSIYWKGGELVFSDVILADSSFHAHIDRASIDFNWDQFPKKMKVHLTLNDPHVAVMKKRSLPESKPGWVEFTVSAINGTLDWDGAANFSFDQTHMFLDWGHSSAFLSFHKDGIEADLKRFRASLLQPWIPSGQILDGSITGRVQLGVDHQLQLAHLQVDDFALSTENTRANGIHGSLSYNAKLGLKWEFRGEGDAQNKQFPLTCQGRGFFKSHWVESEITFDQASCAVRGEKSWEVECQTLRSEQVMLLQECAQIFYPELPNWTLDQGVISFKGNYDLNNWSLQFEGDDLALSNGEMDLSLNKALGTLTNEGGQVSLSSDELEIVAHGKWEDWTGSARYQKVNCAISGGWEGDKCRIEVDKGTYEDLTFQAKGWIDPNFDFSLSMDGDWTLLQNKIPFSCAYLIKEGNDYAFDFRLERKTWDILRLKGTSNGTDIVLNNQCHFLGAPLEFGPAGLGFFDVQFQLPWRSIAAAGPFLQEWGLDLAKVPFELDAAIHVTHRENYSEISARGTSLPFVLSAVEKGNGWEIDLDSELMLSGVYQTTGAAAGKAKWKTGLELEFEGKVTPSFHGEFFLSKIYCDLSQFDVDKIGGVFEGQGHLKYNGSIESDFDLTTTDLKINSHDVDNKGPIHLSYSSTQGALFTGVNIHGPFDCIVELIEYDLTKSHWTFHNSQMHLPGSFLTHKSLTFLDPGLELNFTADLDFSSDLSTFTCTMREGAIPFAGKSHHIENLKLNWDQGQCTADFKYQNYRHRLQLHLDDKIFGRLILGDAIDPLSIDWEYGEALSIHAIEGTFEGIEASFHEENPNVLVGSARLDLARPSTLVPAGLIEVFDELKMGKGYELKGRLSFENNFPNFSGILSGKGFELFGLQLRTLLSRIDISSSFVHFYDMKMSDSSGMMKVDEIIVESREGSPWTIDIPQISITDLRPSLFQKPGKSVGPINPLVVRKLTINDFHGLVDDRKTYTAHGDLHFINSYKREETVFDLPANVLSRIVGLDLDLLIPVCGDLRFSLNDGLVTLDELTNSFSEGNRSEFFLETEPVAFMDLDWNLQILIKMKQFVLFKITESFLISIDGNLGDPQFHLKKKRFFGLL